MNANIADLVDSRTGRQSRAIYSDEAIYRQELERIFGRCWLFLVHTVSVVLVMCFCGFMWFSVSGSGSFMYFT